MSQKSPLISIGPNFWNIRGHFKIMIGLVDIGTHMSIIKLQSGKFVIIDTIPLTPKIKKAIDELTDNGKNIEAIIATHPFHTLSFSIFFKEYPDVPYYGTPRHLRKITDVKWQEKTVNDCEILNKWSPEIEMRIPAGAEFVDPKPEKTNHFNCVFVFHKESRSLHVDDTIMYAEHPGFLLSLAGFRHGTMAFHPSIKGSGLLNNPNAPFQFRDWLTKLIEDWDFDTICTAHFGNKCGGAKQQLIEVLKKAEPLFQKLSEQKKKNPDQDFSNEKGLDNFSGNECG